MFYKRFGKVLVHQIILMWKDLIDYNIKYFHNIVNKVKLMFSEP
jgi:hypothetical protein